jgi:hypothetical protein
MFCVDASNAALSVSTTVTIKNTTINVTTEEAALNATLNSSTNLTITSMVLVIGEIDLYKNFTNSTLLNAYTKIFISIAKLNINTLLSSDIDILNKVLSHSVGAMINSTYLRNQV